MAQRKAKVKKEKRNSAQRDKRTGLFENEDGSALFLFKNGKCSDLPVCNFSIEPVGKFQSAENPSLKGNVLRVTIDSGENWLVPITCTAMSKGDQALSNMNRNESLFCLDSASTHLPMYLQRKLYAFVQRCRDQNMQIPVYTLVEASGCHVLADGTVIHVLHSHSGKTVVYGENGKERPDLHVLMNVTKPAGCDCELLLDEKSILKPVATALLDNTAVENRAQTAMSFGWLISTISNPADSSNALNPFLNVYGGANCGKSTVADVLLKLIGCKNLLKSTSQHKLGEQAVVTSCPSAMDDPPAESDKHFYERFHTYAAAIAEKKTIAKKGSQGKPSRSTAIILSNKIDFEYALHHGLISRSIMLRYRQMPPEIQRAFLPIYVEICEILEQHTCYFEILKLTYHYKKGRGKDWGAQLAEEVCDRWRPLCESHLVQSRSVQCYKTVLEYTALFLDYIDRAEIMDLVWPYLAETASLLRYENAADTMKELAEALEHNWEKEEQFLSQNDAVRKTLVQRLDGVQAVYVAYTRLSKIYPKFQIRMSEITDKASEKWNIRHNFPRMTLSESSVKRTRASSKDDFALVASIQVPAIYIPKEIHALLDAAKANEDRAAGNEDAIAEENVEPEPEPPSAPITPMRTMNLSAEAASSGSPVIEKAVLRLRKREKKVEERSASASTPPRRQPRRNKDKRNQSAKD